MIVVPKQVVDVVADFHQLREVVVATTRFAGSGLAVFVAGAGLVAAEGALVVWHPTSHRNGNVLALGEFFQFAVGQKPAVAIDRRFLGVQPDEQFDTSHGRVVRRTLDHAVADLRVFVLVVAVVPCELLESVVVLLESGLLEPVSVAVWPVRFQSTKGDQVHGPLVLGELHAVHERQEVYARVDIQ